MDEIFSYLPDKINFPIEARHESWFTDDSIDYLSEKNICLAWSDVAGVDNPCPITSNYVYLRIIGDRSISEFGRVVRDRTQSIKNWADKIKKIRTKVSSIVVATNNHYQGFAPATANALRLELGLSDLVWDEKKQKRLEF